MFKIKFKFKPNFHTESKHLVDMAKYETDSFIAAVFIIEALQPCCVDFFVMYDTHKFLPQNWYEFVRQNNPSAKDAPIVQKSLF